MRLPVGSWIWLKVVTPLDLCAVNISTLMETRLSRSWPFHIGREPAILRPRDLGITRQFNDGLAAFVPHPLHGEQALHISYAVLRRSSQTPAPAGESSDAICARRVEHHADRAGSSGDPGA